MSFILSAALCAMIATQKSNTIKPSVYDLDWMAGAHACAIWDGTFEEHWTRASGGTMIGMGRFVKAGQTHMMEYMSIEQAGEKITMFVSLGMGSQDKRRLVPFALTKLEGKLAVFENPKNDFPSRITYKKQSGGTLRCTLTGKTKDKKTEEVFEFKPISR